MPATKGCPSPGQANYVYTVLSYGYVPTYAFLTT
jgi:hypothetical protein